MTGCVGFDGGEYGVDGVHGVSSAIWHNRLQVPFGPLRPLTSGGTIPATMKGFRDALLWHMAQHPTSIAALARGTGVSADVIKKVRSRENASAKAEDAWRIASYFGKDLEQFIRCEAALDDQAFRSLLALLTPQEKKLLEAQMRAMLQVREAR